MKYLHLILSVFFSLSTTFSVFALRLESGQNIRISEPVREDIYVAGGIITIDAPVYGDIFCAGGTIAINDTVTGDIFVVGGDVYLRGTALDDVRMAGGTIHISGNINGDLLLAGGTTTVESSTHLVGDLLLSTGNLTFSGTSDGNCKIAGGEVVLNGAIGKSALINAGKLTLNAAIGGPATIVADHIELGGNAALKGDVRYWNKSGNFDFSKALQNGASASYDATLERKYQRTSPIFLGFATIMGVLGYLIAVFLLLFLGQWLFSNIFQNAATTAKADPASALGFGFLYFIAVPVSVVILCVTLVGIPIGLIVLFFYILFLLLSNVITALVAAHWINDTRQYNWPPIYIVLIALALLVGLHLLSFIPIVGWLLKSAAVLIAFGAILRNTGLFRSKPAGINPN